MRAGRGLARLLRLADRFTDERRSRFVYGVALYPVGPAGTRAVYAGGHSFAIPTSVKDLDGALALVRYLTSAESQYL